MSCWPRDLSPRCAAPGTVLLTQTWPCLHSQMFPEATLIKQPYTRCSCTTSSPPSPKKTPHQTNEDLGNTHEVSFLEEISKSKLSL